MAVKIATKHLRLENYDAFYNHPSNPTLNCLQIEEIFRLHGYWMNHVSGLNRKRSHILEALSGIDNLLNPRRSTVNETLSSCNYPCLTVDEVNSDLTALNWEEDFPIESFMSTSFTTNNNTVVNEIHRSGIEEKKRKKRDKKVKKRKVFDVVHLTKPRSKKNSVIRKCLSDIHGSGIEGERRKKTGLKVQVRKVFDVVHLTKPRSKKNSVKRKRLSDILDFSHTSACLG